MLGVTGHTDLPVAAGRLTTLPHFIPPVGRQSRFGEKGEYAKPTHADAVAFILNQIHLYTDQITLVAIGPLTNLGDMIDKDPGAFRRLKRLVIMGSRMGPADFGGGGSPSGTTPEYNIEADIPAAQRVFNSSVPLYLLPLDSTQQLKLDEVKRGELLTKGTPLTDALGVLYLMWGSPTPVLFDAMSIAYLMKPELCPMEPMHVSVDDSA